MKRSSTISRVLIGCLALAALVGCQPATEFEQLNYSSLGALATLYQQVMSRTGKMPKDEAELRAYAAEQGEFLEAWNVASVDDLFISNRDKQPYTVLFGKNLIVANKEFNEQIVAYETAGVDGKRMVAYLNGHVVEMSDGDFDQLKAP